MRNLTKIAHLGSSPQRAAASLRDHLRRVLTKADRRCERPLQDIDSWSDQTEVAFYEDGGAHRCS